MKKRRILLITTMYPNSLRPGTKVCHYFAKQWQQMGYDVQVVYYRSMFPRIYTDLATLFPKLAKRYVGNHVEMDRNYSIVEEEYEGIPLVSVPIFKYIPHGKYPRREIDHQVTYLRSFLDGKKFEPDVIIGHFFNPQLEIIGRLKELYPQARTCVSLHELNPYVIKKCYPKNYYEIIDGIDVIGFRSIPIKQRFESLYGNEHKSLICWSGTPKDYLEKPSTAKRKFKDGLITKFLYVGQTIKRKYPKETVEGVYKACGDNQFTLTFVGSKDLGYDNTKAFIDANHLEDKVTFVGKKTREEIIRYYDENECFILISKWEVFGLVYLEAMARGCIVIASRDEGMEGIIENGVNGYLCEAGNAKELADIIKKIGTLTAAEKQRISEKAKEKAVELSDQNVAKKYLEQIMN